MNFIRFEDITYYNANPVYVNPAHIVSVRAGSVDEYVWRAEGKPADVSTIALVTQETISTPMSVDQVFVHLLGRGIEVPA